MNSGFAGGFRRSLRAARMVGVRRVEVRVALRIVLAVMMPPFCFFAGEWKEGSMEKSGSVRLLRREASPISVRGLSIYT